MNLNDIEDKKEDKAEEKKDKNFFDKFKEKLFAPSLVKNLSGKTLTNILKKS